MFVFDFVNYCQIRAISKGLLNVIVYLENPMNKLWSWLVLKTGGFVESLSHQSKLKKNCQYKTLVQFFVVYLYKLDPPE